MHFRTKKAPAEDTVHSLPSLLLRTLGKSSFCDVEIVGNDGAPVRVPSYLLAAHSVVFEEIFYPEPSKSLSSSPPPRCQSRPHRISLPLANEDAIEAAVHYLATGSLPDGLEDETTAAAANNDAVNRGTVKSGTVNRGRQIGFRVRVLCQVHLIGRLFRMRPLEDRACRRARLLMTATPRLACAAFDECRAAVRRLAAGSEGEDCECNFEMPSGAGELEAFSQAFLREEPLTTLLKGGTTFLDADTVEDVLRDRAMDTDEYTMFHVLRNWVMQDGEHNLGRGRELMLNIDLACIKPERLINVVRRCCFVDVALVDAALRDVEVAVANRSPEEMEHVRVEGAGKKEANGVYVRQLEDIGMGSDEVVYVKEDWDDDYSPDHTLYLYRSTWSIAPSFDPSNVMYLREADGGTTSDSRKVPKGGWKTLGGVLPAPTCTWVSSKKNECIRDGETGMEDERYVAPDLAKSTQRRLSGIDEGDYDEGNRIRSLGSMMNLPTDEGHKDGDYRDQQHLGKDERNFT